VIARLALTIAASTLLAVVLVSTVAGMAGSSTSGSPDRGRAVYLGPGGCAGCHSVSTDPTEPSTGPQLTLQRLQTDAAAAGEPLGPFVAESILVPNAFTAPGYVSGIMQPARGLSTNQVEDLVSFLIGKPWTAPAGGALKLPKRPVAACDASSSCRAQVRRWARVERLPRAAIAGAKIVAVSGCLSCHRYAGAGKMAAGAPDLTRAGLKRITDAARARHLACPSCVTRGSSMPSYAAYGDANLRLVAEFLRASRGTTR